MKRTLKPTARIAIKPLTAAIATLLSGSYAGVTLAQSAQLEEIIVTASRRETTIQELPFNIAAIGGDQLDEQRLTSLTELGRWVPGLSIVDQGPRSASLLTVRGLNVQSINDSEFLNNASGGTVGTYLGEVPLYLDFKMKDLERVEVLIGPQGTLYGEGTLGGAVRYIPKAPSSKEFSLEAHGNLYALSHSDSEGYKADLVLNAPIAEDKLAFRAAIGYTHDPGFIDYPYLVNQPGVSNPQPDLNDPAAVAANLHRQNDVDWEHTLSSRVALLWNVSSTVDVTFNYYHQDQDVGGRTVNHRFAFNTGKYESAARFVEPNDRKSDLFSVEVVADLGFAQLVSATGVSRYDQVGQRDQTDLLLDLGYGYESFPQFVAYTRELAKEKRTNEEVRLVSKGTGKLSWIAGAFYNDFDLNGSSSEFVPGFDTFVGLSLPTGDLEFRQASHQTLSQTALFGEVGYRFTDKLQVNVGGRFFSYDFTNTSTILVPLVDFSDANAGASSDNGFLGKINAAYDFTKDVMGYVTLSEGYRNGGANPVAVCPAIPPGGTQIPCGTPNEINIAPDTTTNLEFGMHSSWNGGKLIFNAAVYHIDWDKVQTLSTTVSGALPITVNGGKAESKGLELSLQSRGDHWSFTGTYAHNRAELTTFAPGIVDGVEDGQPGDRLPGSPEQQASFYAAYRRPLRNGFELNAGYGLSYSGNVFTKVGLRNDGETLGAYTVHSLSAGIGHERWQANLYIDNLTDKFAETGVRLDPSYIRNVNGFDLRRYYRDVIRPRTLGLEFRYRI
ncbi:MAG: TonB-dependent receptor [Gammaproteobacteria bacterium]